VTWELEELFRIYEELLDRRPEGADVLEKLVFCGVQIIVQTDHEAMLAVDTTRSMFGFSRHVVQNMAQLTPAQLIRLFPVENSDPVPPHMPVDYASTMETLLRYGMHTPIGENVFDILFEYANPELRLFLSKLLCLTGLLRIIKDGTD